MRATSAQWVGDSGSGDKKKNNLTNILQHQHLPTPNSDSNPIPNPNPNPKKYSRSHSRYQEEEEGGGGGGGTRKTPTQTSTTHTNTNTCSRTPVRSDMSLTGCFECRSLSQSASSGLAVAKRSSSNFAPLRERGGGSSVTDLRGRAGKGRKRGRNHDG